MGAGSGPGEVLVDRNPSLGGRTGLFWCASEGFEVGFSRKAVCNPSLAKRGGRESLTRRRVVAARAVSGALRGV